MLTKIQNVELKPAHDLPKENKHEIKGLFQTF